MLLFERCASEVAYQRLVTAVKMVTKGVLVFRRVGESARQARKSTVWTATGTPHSSRDWLALEPALAEFDLRAVVYVSRETMPIVTSADQMSTEALELLEGVLY